MLKDDKGGRRDQVVDDAARNQCPVERVALYSLLSGRTNMSKSKLILNYDRNWYTNIFDQCVTGDTGLPWSFCSFFSTQVVIMCFIPFLIYHVCLTLLHMYVISTSH